MLYNMTRVYVYFAYIWSTNVPEIAMNYFVPVE